jgi:hypothetical protein
MSFNLGIPNHPSNRLGGLGSIGVYLYQDIYYRQWITEIALAFYEGRQDIFVWLDLVRQFRNPEKQQILPVNLTKEIIDETAILFREQPIYQVVNESGEISESDQKLWEEIQRDSRYHTFMDKLDRWTKLLGTVLVKVSFVDDSGRLVKENASGRLQLDMLHGGVYDVRYGASPYYITELVIGFGTSFNGFQTGGIGQGTQAGVPGGGLMGTVPSPSDLGTSSATTKNQVDHPGKLAPVNKIYWSPSEHSMHDKHNNEYSTKNPYGVIPAVPFFNQDPAHYYFLPIDEPLIYANHALNMRITDLNHIAKFQSFGVPVVSGVERPSGLRQGRPVDDFNQLKGGSAQSRFGGISGVSGFGGGGQFRTFDGGLGIFRDGNADANALGISIGPDTAIAVGEKGDFKFAHPSADIMGLMKTIHGISDMVRINHGLRAKFDQALPASGFAMMLEKMGVIEENIRRGKLFKEREQQLFDVIRTMWNIHHNKAGDTKFSEDCKLEVTYVQPHFPVDPKTNIETILMENKLLDTGDRESIRKLYPHLNDIEVNKIVKERRKDKEEQALFETELQIKTAQLMQDSGLDSAGGASPNEDKKHKYVAKSGGDRQKVAYTYEDEKGKEKTVNREYDVAKPKIDKKVAHSIGSSKQKDKNGDPRK